MLDTKTGTLYRMADDYDKTYWLEDKKESNGKSELIMKPKKNV